MIYIKINSVQLGQFNLSNKKAKLLNVVDTTGRSEIMIFIEYLFKNQNVTEVIQYVCMSQVYKEIKNLMKLFGEIAGLKVLPCFYGSYNATW